jgi:cytochrome c-type biogenesis protein CcmH
VRRLALVAAAVAALAIAGQAAASEQHPTLSEIEGEVLCVSCNQPLDMSQGTFADRERAIIRHWIAAGDTKSQVERKLVDQFGENVLLSPPDSGFNILAWWLPIVGILAGAMGIAYGVWRWSRGRGGPTGGLATKMDPELDRRLDDELARFDA